MKTWHDKAHEMIASEAMAAYLAANTSRRRKKHVPYTLPAWVDDLVATLGRNDERAAKRIMMYPHLRIH